MVDELYSYILNHEQRPCKWSYGQETSPIIARKVRKPPPPPPPPPPRSTLRWVLIAGVLVVLMISIGVVSSVYLKESDSTPTSVPVISMSNNVTDETSSQLIVPTDTPPALPPTETPSPIPEPEETITQEPTSPDCDVPHPPIPESDINGSVTIADPLFTGDCFEATQGRLLLEIRWEDVTPGAELWLFVYSPLAKLYYPHHCVTIQSTAGGQTCLSILGRPEPYDIVVILADASAHADLLDIASRGSGAEHVDLPTGISEMSHISVVRTK